MLPAQRYFSAKRLFRISDFEFVVDAVEFKLFVMLKAPNDYTWRNACSFRKSTNIILCF